MIGFEERDNALYVENIPLAALAEDIGTPAYVYSAAAIKHQYDALANAVHNALPKTQKTMFCYAAKANSNVAILAYLRSLGSDLEVVSAGEIRRGLKAGFKGEQIVFTGVGKSVDEIAFALEHGIYQFNVESLPELHRIQDVAKDVNKEATVVFRLNPDIEGAALFAKTSTGGKKDKFGINAAGILDAYDFCANASHVRAVGISVHIGSQISKVEKYEEAFAKMPELVNALRDKGYEVSRLDVGGGFPIDYNDDPLLDLDQYAQWVNDIIVPLDVEIMLEPGRYYIGNAGVLLTKVEYVKETPAVDFIVLDSAMNDLIRPTLYDAYHGVEAVENRDRPRKTYDVVGPICESGDTFTKNRELPEMKQGELAVIQSAGAYGFCMASNYNTRPMPAEVLVKDRDFDIIRPRQTYDDIINCESIPDWI